MKRISAFALIALAAATVAVAQTTPQTPAESPPGDTPQGQYPNPTSPPADQSAGTGSESNKADKETQMKKCMADLEASYPGSSQQDVKKHCEKHVNKPQG